VSYILDRETAIHIVGHIMAWINMEGCLQVGLLLTLHTARLQEAEVTHDTGSSSTLIVE